MYKLHLILFFSTLGIFHISSAPNSKTDQPTLPLTLIHFIESCFHPTKLQKVTKLEGTNVISGGTIFSNESDGYQIFLCSIPNYQDKISSTQLKFGDPEDRYCSYPIHFEESEPLRCIEEPQPFVRKIYLSAGLNPPRSLRCGWNKRGKKYWFTFKICFPENVIENYKLQRAKFSLSKIGAIEKRSRFETYRFCFNEETNEVMYTYHTIRSPRLLRDQRLQSERKKEYEMSADGYQYFDDWFQTLKDEYEKQDAQQKSLSKSQLEPSTAKYSYKAQKLVPPDDMAFAIWRKTTYHYLNVKLLREDLTFLWNHISDLIRNDAIKRKRQYNIFTGTFNASESGIGEITEIQIPTPDIWIKIVHHFYTDKTIYPIKGHFEGLAIVLDTKFEYHSGDTFFKESCQENLCENAFAESFPKIHNSIRCCQATAEIQNFFGLKGTKYENLDINFSNRNTDDVQNEPESEDEYEYEDLSSDESEIDFSFKMPWFISQFFSSSPPQKTKDNINYQSINQSEMTEETKSHT